MLIHQAMEKTGLTRKAIHYYEQIGLITPKILESGYRDYNKTDLEKLDKIIALRQVDMPASMMKKIFAQPERATEVFQQLYAQLTQKQQLVSQQIDKLKQLQKHWPNVQSIQKIQGENQTPSAFTLDFCGRFKQAFPGYFGEYMAAHFSLFSDIMIDTQEKLDAFQKIIDYLDELEITVELHDPEVNFTQEQKTTMHNGFNEFIKKFLRMSDDEKLANILDSKQKYEEMRDTLNNEAPGKLKEYDDRNESLRKTLQGAGYYDVVTRNLRILMPEYGRYMSEMERLQAILDEREQVL